MLLGYFAVLLTFNLVSKLFKSQVDDKRNLIKWNELGFFRCSFSLFMDGSSFKKNRAGLTEINWNDFMSDSNVYNFTTVLKSFLSTKLSTNVFQFFFACSFYQCQAYCFAFHPRSPFCLITIGSANNFLFLLFHSFDFRIAKSFQLCCHFSPTAFLIKTF